MLDSASELDLESDTSSVDGNKDAIAINEQLSRRVDSLQQENRVLKTEVETLKLKIKGLNETIHQLRRNSVNIQAKAEQEEEFISNTLLKKITELKKEKESLALNYEQEEECLTNELNRKFTQLRQEKVALERTLAREQEDQVSKLKSRIEKLETDMNNKQELLDRLRREKIELENALEQEQESLVNRLWKKMEKLETEKKVLQEKLESLGALLSASSSNQSLTSVNQVTASANGAILGSSSVPVTSVCGLPSSRPTSGGPGSHRTFSRDHTVSRSYQPAFSVSPPQTTTASSVASSRPLIPSTLLPSSGTVASTDARIQLNQSSSVPNDSSHTKINTHDDSCTHLLPPQSPMDVDSLDHLTSGTTSPIRLDGAVGQMHIRMVHPPKLSVSVTSVHKMSESEDPISGASRPLQELNATWDSHTTSTYVNRLRDEVYHLRQLLEKYETESATKMPLYECEERSAAEENRRLRKLLQLEKERREALSRQLSESESSLEMEDERQFNEACRNPRVRTTSDSSFHPPSHIPNPSMIFGPGHAYAAAVAAGLGGQCSTAGRVCRECGQRLPPLWEDWSFPPTSSIRILPTSLHTSTTACRVSHARCCSPGKSCGSHHVSLPTSPATPTTSSGCLAQTFAKPNATRLPNSMSPHDRNMVVVDLRDPLMEKGLSPYSSAEQLFASGDLADMPPEPDDDEDARCATPPVCQPDSTRTN